MTDPGDKAECGQVCWAQDSLSTLQVVDWLWFSIKYWWFYIFCCHFLKGNNETQSLFASESLRLSKCLPMFRDWLVPSRLRQLHLWISLPLGGSQGVSPAIARPTQNLKSYDPIKRRVLQLWEKKYNNELNKEKDSSLNHLKDGLWLAAQTKKLRPQVEIAYLSGKRFTVTETCWNIDHQQQLGNTAQLLRG